MIEIKICLWNWASYNDGVSDWEWFTLPQDEEKMQAWIKDLYTKGKEEFFICDSEHNFIEESTSIKALIDLSNHDFEEIIELAYYEPAYSMDDFDEIMSGYTPMEIANMIHFGAYSPMDDYFTFDGYGNIETLSDIEYEDQQEDAFNEGAEEFLRNF